MTHKNVGPFLRYNRAWFDLNQESLLRLLNGRFTRGVARMLMRIRPYDVPLNAPICQITPNSFSYGLQPINDRWQITTDFRTHPKYAKRVYFAMRPFLALAHAFDMRSANPFRPAWNLGFDELTAYPQAEAADPQTTCDGFLYKSTAVSWADARASAGAAYLSDTFSDAIYGERRDGTGNWRVGKIIATFDTSALTSGASISAATFGLYGSDVNDTESTYPADPVLLETTISDASTFTTSDWGSFNATALANVGDLGTWTTSGYNSFALNASGLSIISKTGITKLGLRAKNDIDNNEPTNNSRCGCYFADYTGSTRDPKLFVTYTVAAGGIPKHMDYYRRMRLK